MSKKVKLINDTFLRTIKHFMVINVILYIMSEHIYTKY